MKLIQALLLRLLYFTPIGYALSLLNIMKQNDQFGIRINFPKERGKSITVSIVPNPTISMRLSWFLNGVVVLGESFWGIIALYNYDWLGKNSEGSLVGFTVMTAVIGLTQIAVALFPKVNWNRSL